MLKIWWKNKMMMTWPAWDGPLDQTPGLFPEQISLMVTGKKFWDWFYHTECLLLVVMLMSNGKTLGKIKGKTCLYLIWCRYLNYTMVGRFTNFNTFLFQHSPYKEFCVEISKISWCYLAGCRTVFKLVKHVCWNRWPTFGAS